MVARYRSPGSANKTQLRRECVVTKDRRYGVRDSKMYQAHAGHGLHPVTETHR